jgi:SH3 domain protein
MNKRLLIFLFASTLAFNISAQEEGEILYVTDILRLSLYETANQNSKRLQYLSSGERLDVTEKKGPYAYVRTDSGRKGWVKRGFLVSKIPTVLLLEQEQEKTEALIQEINKLANSSLVIKQYEEDMDVLSAELKTTTEDKDAIQTDLNNLKKQFEKNRRKLDVVVDANQHKAKPLDLLITIVLGYWRYLLPICFGFILFGYIISGRILKARLKRRFQGIKVW